METIHIQFDDMTEHMALVHISTGLKSILMTSGQISSGLVPNPVLVATYVPPTNKDLEILFQPMFDEYFEPPSVKRPVPYAPTVQILVVSADLGELRPTADIGIFVDYAPNRKGYRINNKRTQQIMETIHVQFDELAEPMAPVTSVEELSLFFQVPFVSTGTPSSTIINQVAPSTRYSPLLSIVQPHISHQGVAARPTLEDNPFAQAANDPFINVFAPKPSSDESSSRDVSSFEST
nr:retrovirus-related Pol polyprotein from transposon TNT 1-94 [Tanacetum cinerariifolium]